MPIAAIAALPAVAPLAAAPEAPEGAQGHGAFARLLSRSRAEGDPADAAQLPAGRSAGKPDARAASHRGAVQQPQGPTNDDGSGALPTTDLASDPSATPAPDHNPDALDSALHPVMAELLATLQTAPTSAAGPAAPPDAAGEPDAAPGLRPGDGRAERRAASSGWSSLSHTAAEPDARTADPARPSHGVPIDTMAATPPDARPSSRTDRSATTATAPDAPAAPAAAARAADTGGAAQDLAAAGMLRGEADARRTERAAANDGQAARGVEGGSFVSALAVAAPPLPVRGHEPAQPLPVTLPTPLHSPEFPQALGVQVSLLARDGVQHAQLNLNPAEMGPVSVRIVMDGPQANVQFGADLAATRSAIESSLPALASALSDAGLTLTGGGVSQHAGGRGSAPDRQGAADTPGRGAPGAVTHAAELALAATPSRLLRAGGIDLYA